MKNDAQEIGEDFKNAPVVFFQNPGNAGTQLLHEFKIPEDPHDFLVPG